MKLVSILMLMTTLLMSCSTNESQNNEENDKIIEESILNETDNDLSEEEILLNNLPEEIELEDWNLILVNPVQALPDNFEVELTEVDNEQSIDSRVVEAWTSWKEAALEEGYRLFFASGFRDISKQETNFNHSIQKYMDQGLTEEEAIEKSKEYLTEPGHSEHHTGLALDIVDEDWIVSGQALEQEYENEESQQWLVSSMSDYGFILRYPKGKEEITGINYEPWHFRYVGVENAKFIEENDLTLEEYIELLIEVNK